MIPLHQRILRTRVYAVNHRTEYIIYLRCRNIAFCFGTTRMGVDMAEITEIAPRSAACHVDEHAMDIACFRDALKTEMQRQYYHLRDLYDTMALLYPEGASMVAFEVIRPSLIVWRRRMYPARPRNLLQFGQ